MGDDVGRAVALNGELLFRRECRLEGRGGIWRLDEKRMFPLPGTAEVKIRATISGRWKDEALEAVLHWKTSDKPAKALREFDPDPPESQFDDDYIDAVADMNSLLQRTWGGTEPVVSSHLDFAEDLVWKNVSGASVIHGRTFRLQIRVQVFYDVSYTTLTLTRSVGSQSGSSNTAQSQRCFFLFVESHFGDKHAVAATLALYPDARAAVIDNSSVSGALRDRMKIYFESIGRLPVPIVTGASNYVAHVAGCLTSPGSATRLVANKFRESVEDTLLALRKDWLKIGDRDSMDHRRAVAVWLATQADLLRGAQPKVIVWVRGKPFKTEGNPSPELVCQLAQLLRAEGPTPLIVGEQCPLKIDQLMESRAIDFTSHWRQDVFDCKDSYLRQNHMFDLLKEDYGLVGVVGGKSGSLECTAMLGISTMWFCNGAPPFYEPRLYQWDGFIPHYRSISVAGLVATSRATGGGAAEPIPYEEQRIGPLKGTSLGILTACFRAIRQAGGPRIDLWTVRPDPVLEIKVNE